MFSNLKEENETVTQENARSIALPKGWVPKTELGKAVAEGRITSMDQIIESGKKILEWQIYDVLLPDLKEEVIEVSSVQRMTGSGRKQAMRAVILIGNSNGFVGVGVGRGPETRDAIAKAIIDGKKHLIKVRLGCGSWEDSSSEPHSIPEQAIGGAGSAQLTLKPAPRGVGLVAGSVVKLVLSLAGVKDVWTFTKGRTRNKLNMARATVNALDSLNTKKSSKRLFE
ncbi:30S ribosomal protein S5 [uncultured archaeon]|nr:30S ribosomal protein S5 [uncultured archaeon]